jgi:SAM-dependent methyltransferase
MKNKTLSYQEKRDHWSDIARQWEQIGPPLRPCIQDIAYYSDAVDLWVRGNGVPRAVILGVTPELYRLPWPKGTDVLAVDHTREMIDTVWPGPREAAICADWTNLPLDSATRDIVLCDGGLHLLAYPQSQQKLVRNLHRIVKPNGLCVLRLFILPSQRESTDAVLQDLLAARISNLNILKLRLGMAMQEDIKQGVQLADVWDEIHRAAPDLGRLAMHVGWPLEHLQAINTYRDCLKRYHFFGLTEVRRLFCENPGGFAVETVHVPTYELGERCPIVVFRRNEFR